MVRAGEAEHGIEPRERHEEEDKEAKVLVEDGRAELHKQAAKGRRERGGGDRRGDAADRDANEALARARFAPLVGLPIGEAKVHDKVARHADRRREDDRLDDAEAPSVEDDDARHEADDEADRDRAVEGDEHLP